MELTRPPWRRRSRRTVYENPWITVLHDEVDRPDGSPGIYGVVHFRYLAAGAVVLDGDDRILVVGQHRYTLDGRITDVLSVVGIRRVALARAGAGGAIP